MLDKINDTGLIITGAIFAVAGLWDVVFPVNEILIKDAWTLILTILAAAGIITSGTGLGLKLERKNQAKKKAEAIHGQTPE